MAWLAISFGKGLKIGAGAFVLSAPPPACSDWSGDVLREFFFRDADWFITLLYFKQLISSVFCHESLGETTGKQ